MNFNVAIVVLSILALTRFGAFGIDQCQLDQIKTDLLASISEDRVRRIGSYVRFAFHDCIGGCDGCMDLTHPENGGLDVSLNDLETIYSKYKDLLSRADFWQLAGITAIQSSYNADCKTCISPNLLFKTGRTDCPSSPDYFGPAIHFPVGSGHADMNSVMSFLENTFDLPRAEPWLGVALMGVHSLGEAHREASGWNGRFPWSHEGQGLSIEYFEALMAPIWSQDDINDDPDKAPVFQWRQGTENARWFAPDWQSVMLLNADITLARKISPDATGKASCPVASLCPEQTETFEWVRKYAGNKNLWEKNFSIAYMRMITEGYTEADFEDIAPCP